MAKKEKTEALVPAEEQPYPVPENWRWVRLGSVVDDMADGPFGSNLKTEHYTDEKEVRIIQLSNISEEGWREENTKYTTFEHVKNIERSVVKPGEIVIAKMMPAGRAMICPDNERMYVLSSDAVRATPVSYVDNVFMVRAINSPYFQNQVRENTQGITRARTSISKLRGYAFALPPLSEQLRIADVIQNLFAKLDEAKEKAQAVVDGFEDRKAAILHKAFTGELTEKWRKERGISFSTWNTYSLKDCCFIGSGGTPSRKEPNYYEGSIPWIKTGEINWNYIYDSEEHISESAVENSSAKVYPVGSVLVAMYGMGVTRGRASILNISAATNQAVCVLQPCESLINRYLFYFFMDNYWRIREQAVGGNQLNLSATIIGKLNIQVPLLDEQERIIYVLDNLLENESQVKDHAEHIIESIDDIKKSILAKAFRGELGTNDPAEPPVEF